MYPIMIVDDEILVRVGLKATIDWGSLGFSIVAEAANGEQALELFREFRPRVVLTDIKMPRMDGLTLTREIRAIDPTVKVVILTAHDEFSLARESVRMGAFRYVLKSEVEDDEMTGMFTEIRQALDNEQKQAQIHLPAAEGGDISQTALRRKILLELLENNIPADAERLNTGGLGSVDLSSQHYILALLQEDAKLPEVEATIDSLQHIIDDVLQEQGISCLTNRNRDFHVLLFVGENASEGKCHWVIQQIKTAVRRYLNLTMSATCGHVFASLSQVKAEFDELRSVARLFFYMGNDSEVSPEQAKTTRLHDPSYRDTFSRQLIEQMNLLDIEGANATVAQLTELVSRKRYSPLQVKLLFIDLKNDLVDYYFAMINDPDAVDELANLSQNILDARRLSQVHELMLVGLDGIFVLLKNHRIHNPKGIVQRARNYINDKIDQPLSLESIAGQVKVSKQYLCALFKKETGENLTTFINRQRIAKATELIRQYDYRTKEIYDLVGFSDPQYFSKIFKKVTGKTVADYRAELDQPGDG